MEEREQLVRLLTERLTHECRGAFDETEIDDIAKRAVATEMAYEADLADEAAFDADDAFEAVFLALCGDDESMNARLAAYMEPIMDELLA